MRSGTYALRSEGYKLLRPVVYYFNSHCVCILKHLKQISR